MLRRRSSQIGGLHIQQRRACSHQHCRDPQSRGPMPPPVPDAVTGCCNRCNPVTPYQRHTASNGHLSGQFLAVTLNPGLQTAGAFLEEVASRCRPLKGKQRRHCRPPRQAPICPSRSHIIGQMAIHSRGHHYNSRHYPWHHLQLHKSGISAASLGDGIIRVHSMTSTGFRMTNSGSSSDCPMDVQFAAPFGLRVTG